MTIRMSARRLTFVVLPLLFLLILMPFARADDQGEGPLIKDQPKGTTPEEIIQRFAAKEKQFKEAREQYTWRQDVLVKEPDTGGEFHMVTDILFDDHGKRVEHVVF